MRVVALALALACVASVAHADTVVELPRTKARLTLPDGWELTSKLAEGPLVAVYTHGDGARLAVTRADVPNSEAWKDKPERRQAYADEIERGIQAAVPGYKRTSKKLGTANGVPALDVEARRDGGATVVVRILLFRTYALALALEVPRGGSLAGARKIALAFAPPKA